MLSRSYIHVNVNTVRGTQPVKTISLNVMRKTRLQNIILYGQKTSKNSSL